MNEKDFRNGLFAFFSREGFVKTYKTQLRLAVHRYASSQRDFSYAPFQHSLRSEVICNIIADYLKAHTYRDSLIVFTEEAAYHRLSQSDLIQQTEVSNAETTFLEALMKRKRKSNGSRSIACQTELLSLHEKLLLIDDSILSTRSTLKSVNRQKNVVERLERIRADRKSEYEEKLRHSFEAQRVFELSRSKIEANERFRTESQRMKAEYESLYLARSQELRLAREQEEATARLLQQELDRQLSNLRNGEQPKEPQSEININDLKRRCNIKLHNMLSKAKKIIKQRELIQQRINNEKIEYKETLKKLIELRQTFAAIQIK